MTKETDSNANASPSLSGPLGGEDDFSAMSADEVFSRLDSNRNGLSSEESARRLDRYGRNSLESKRVPLWRRLVSYFWGPIPWMIEVAAVLSAVNRDWKSFGVIVAMLAINGGIGFWQEESASDALESLKKQLALKTRVRRDDRWQEINAVDLVPGDVVRIRLGDIVPADIKLFGGQYLSVDQSTLTGESLPVSKGPGEFGFSGTLVKEGEMEAVVCTTGPNTYFGKTAQLVEKAGAVSHFQKAVLRIGNLLVICAAVLSGILVGVEIARGMPLLELLSFVLIVVVASIPVALPAVLSATMALGALALSRMKAIVSRLEAIEEMAGVDVLCSDKTGTLTQNRLTLGEPVVFDAADSNELVLCGALASKEEDQDAIDLAVIDGLRTDGALRGFEQFDFVPFDPRSKRTEATIRKGEDRAFHVTKGAPQVIMEMCHLNDQSLKRARQVIDEAARKGYRTLGVGRSLDDGKTWHFLGILPLFDPPREDSKQTIKQAQNHGITVKMVTGDNAAIATEVGRQLGLGSCIRSARALFVGDSNRVLDRDSIRAVVEETDGFAEVFPEHKFAIVKALQDAGHIVAMTGDGVNDAPALKQAEVGIAVSGATDAARSAASLILTAPGLSVITRAVEEARRIFERMMSYTIYRIAMTLSILVFVVMTMLIYNDYPLTTIMIILLALLDDIPIMTIAWDNAELSAKPVRWQMDRLLWISGTMGALALAQSFGLFLLARDVFAISLAKTQTMMFLRFILGGHLLLFVTRTRHSFWKPPYPSWQLFSAIAATQVAGLFFVGFGWLMPAISWIAIGLIWVYDLAWMVVMDLVKVGVYHMIGPGMKHHQTFLTMQKRRLHGIAGP